jgi:hypothetical protein
MKRGFSWAKHVYWGNMSGGEAVRSGCEQARRKAVTAPPDGCSASG